MFSDWISMHMRQMQETISEYKLLNSACMNLVKYTLNNAINRILRVEILNSFLVHFDKKLQAFVEKNIQSSPLSS
jgi:hypothetical protein